jgi:hypothetical protein
MNGPDACQPTSRRRRAVGVWPACATLLLVLAACSPGPDRGSLAASQGGNPSPTGAQPPGASASESEAPSPSITESGTLTGTWNGTWAIDPPYEATIGTFTMDLVQAGNSFSGPVVITNTDCSNGTVDGSVDGTSVTFGWVLTPQPVQFTGVLNGTSMSGTWAAQACSDATISLTGTWEATKQ